ncbi:anti-sigma factor family protein [Lacunimicrobium album]
MICREATQAISQSFDAKLTRLKRLDLAIHTMLCVSCRRFQRQMVELHQNFEKLGDEVTSDMMLELPVVSRERMTAELKQRPDSVD